jgi:hypothetical protein
MNNQIEAETAAAIQRLYEMLNKAQDIWDMWHEAGDIEGMQIITNRMEGIRLEIAYLNGDLPRPAPRRQRASRR